MAVVFLVLEAICDLLQPTLMSHIVDEGVLNNNIAVILQYGVYMLCACITGAVSAVIRNHLASRTSQRAGRDLRASLYKKIQTFSYQNIDKLHTGTLITRITNDVTQIQQFINGCMRILVKAPITCIGAVAFIITRTPQLAPVTLTILLACFLFIACNMSFGYPRFMAVQKKLDRLNTVSREFLSAIRVVKAFGREDLESEKFASATKELAASNASALHVSAVFGPLIHFTVNIGIIALLWIGGTGRLQNIGKLMASVNYTTQMLFSLSMVSNILNTLVRASASADRIQEVLEEQPAMQPPAAPAVFKIKSNITFKNVSFTYYKAAKETLSDISFQIASGSTVGIIGSTGSGKSTLVNLIPRFYDVSGGAIFVGHTNINQIDEQELRRKIGIVPQKNVLFTGTIKENILWGNPQATAEQIEKAAAAACADTFIRKFPLGYDTLLGQGGVNVSGGQKQRISIARALLRQPQILILDDCTSALDAATEATVMQNIRTSAADATIFLISQRVSSVMQADVILCMENGRLYGCGTHAQLLAECSVYQEIYRSQMGEESNG